MGKVKIEIPIEDLKNSKAGSSDYIWGTGYGNTAVDGAKLRLGIKWWSTVNGTGSDVTVQVFVRCSSINFSTTKYGQTYIDGTNYGFNVAGMNYGNGSGPLYNVVHVATASKHVGHNSDGNKSITIEAFLDINITYAGVSVSRISSSTTAHLDKIAIKPGDPTNLRLTGLFDTDELMTLTWDRGAGTIDKNRIFWMYYTPQNGWSNWELFAERGDVSTYQYRWRKEWIKGFRCKFRIDAWNGPHDSNWSSESNELVRSGARVYNGSNFVSTNRNLAIWNGSSWVNAYIRVWNGSSWEIAR